MKNTNLIVTILSLSCFVVNAEPIGEITFAVSNNAVAAAKTSSGWQVFSFNGLGIAKDWASVNRKVMGFDLLTRKSFLVNSVPYQQGRLASIAVTVDNQIYLFGGYTVSSDLQESSVADVYRFDAQSGEMTLFSQMPVAVDDTVALVYRDRYIYLVSGWHDTANVANVQVLDTKTGGWFEATPFPGEPVFGHAGGIVGDQLVIADGVKVAAVVNGKRQYQMASASFIGKINPKNLQDIQWSKLPPHPGKALYRMAASGFSTTGVVERQVIFLGGSDNPYNFNGIGYNGVSSEPSSSVFAWDFVNHQWKVYPDNDLPTMDHRGLLNIDGRLLILGGMLADQKVSNLIIEYSRHLEPELPNTQ